MKEFKIDRKISKRADEFAEREYVSGADEREWLSKGYYWGYKDAEKELKLTWEDMKAINDILETMTDQEILGTADIPADEEQYYKEALRRYESRRR